MHGGWKNWSGDKFVGQLSEIEKVVKQLKDIPDIQVALDTDLSRIGTFKLSARGNLIKAFSKDALVSVIKLLKDKNIDFRPVGLGANQLIEDATNFFYLKYLYSPKVEFNPKDKEYIFSAGITLNKLTNFAIKYELKGWEVFTGVPATLGGAVVMNAGTNLGEIGDLVSSVEYINKNGELDTHIVNKDSFSYRTNNFLKKGEFVTEVILKNIGFESGIGDRIKEYLEYRTKTQPLWDKTCGCTFKNYESIESKLPAGMYIDLAGLKGYQCGKIKVSEKHANFFVNTENAKKHEVIDFIGEVQSLLKRSYGVTFEKEIKTD